MCQGVFFKAHWWEQFIRTCFGKFFTCLHVCLFWILSHFNVHSVHMFLSTTRVFSNKSSGPNYGSQCLPFHLDNLWKMTLDQRKRWHRRSEVMSLCMYENPWVSSMSEDPRMREAGEERTSVRFLPARSRGRNRLICREQKQSHCAYWDVIHRTRCRKWRNASLNYAWKSLLIVRMLMITDDNTGQRKQLRMLDTIL